MNTNLNIDKNKEKHMHDNHRNRMRETYLKSGFQNFTEVQKLEFMLFFGISRKDTNPIAHRLLEEFGSIDRIIEAPIDKLKRIKGVGEHTAILLKTFLDVIACYGKSKCVTKLPTVKEAKPYVRNLLMGAPVEEFHLLCLSSDNTIVYSKKIGEGTKSSVSVTLKTIIREILNSNCERVIFCHNHPTGLPTPSDDDISFTQSLVLNCSMCDIEVLDHIITSKHGEYSFEQEELLPQLKRRVKLDIIKAKGYLKFEEKSSNYGSK